MQTFLPYKEFKLSAESLDKQRAWKQVVEAKQIHNTLTGLSKGWLNHPAVKMWSGYENALAEYHNVFLQHCVNEHKIKVVKSKPIEIIGSIVYPPWLGNEKFHSAHRFKLKMKKPEFYTWDDSPSEYVWPTHES